MPGDFLGSIEISVESKDRTPEEFIELAHDPDILYYYIQDAKAKLESGIEIDADGKEEDILIHTKVEIFQSVIQYVEAFSIYYLAYIKGREDLIEYLISTYPEEVKKFYTNLRNGKVEGYLDEHDIDSEYRDLLETLFGYRFMSEEANEEDLEQMDLEESSFDSIGELVEFSAKTLDDRIRTVAQFYLDFGNAYNAVKHGNRAIPQVYSEFQILPKDGENMEVDIDLEFVQFLCKHDGDAYITAIPIDYLLDHSLYIADTVHDLFIYLRRIAKAAIDDDRKFSVPLFEPAEGERSSGQEWTKVWNEHSVIILPVTEEISELMSESSVDHTVACRLQLDGNSVVIETENDEEISDEYPVLTTISQQGIQGLTPRPCLHLSMNVDLDDLDVQHYFELLELKDATADGEVIRTKLKDEEIGEEFVLGEIDSVTDLSVIPDPFERERIKQLAVLQHITDVRIPAPMELIEPQIEAIEDWINSDRNEKDAVAAVERLQEIGNHLDSTLIYIDRINLHQGTLESEFVGTVPGSLNFDIKFSTEEEGETFEEQWGPSRMICFPVDGYSGDYEDLISYLEEDIERVDEVLESLSGGTGPIPDLRVKYKLGEQGFWGMEHTLHLQIIDAD